MTYWLDLLAFQEQPCHFPLTVWASAAIQTCADRRVSVMYGGGSTVEVGAACCAAQSRKGFINGVAFAAWLQIWSVFWPNLCFYLSSSSQHHLLAWLQWSDEKQVLLFYTYAQGLTWWFVPGGGRGFGLSLWQQHSFSAPSAHVVLALRVLASFPPTHSRTVSGWSLSRT